MNNQEAKLILQAYRPGGQDAQDPQFAEALKQTQCDPELAQWFELEQKLDAAINRKLTEAPVPRELKTAILAGEKILRPTPWWRRRTVIALAAALVFLIALASFWLAPHSQANLAALRQDMAAMLTTGSYRLGLATPDLKKVQAWLAQNQGHGDFVLPQGMQGLPGVGCQVLDWQGRRVTMVCLQMKGTGVVHLFVINRSDLPDPPPQGRPQFAQAGEWTTASWSQGGKAYVLTGLADRATLKKCL